MAKYEELSEMFTEISDRREELKQLTKSYIHELMNGLAKDLELKPGTLRFFRPDNFISENKEEKMLYETIILYPDNLWHFIMEIMIEHKSKSNNIGIYLYLKVRPTIDGKFIIRHYDLHDEFIKEFVIDPITEDNSRFYNHTYTFLKTKLNEYKYPLED